MNVYIKKKKKQKIVYPLSVEMGLYFIIISTCLTQHTFFSKHVNRKARKKEWLLSTKKVTCNTENAIVKPLNHEEFQILESILKCDKDRYLKLFGVEIPHKV